MYRPSNLDSLMMTCSISLNRKFRLHATKTYVLLIGDYNAQSSNLDDYTSADAFLSEYFDFAAILLTTLTKNVSWKNIIYKSIEFQKTTK